VVLNPRQNSGDTPSSRIREAVGSGNNSIKSMVLGLKMKSAGPLFGKQLLVVQKEVSASNLTANGK
jgi:hypothetical protein